MTVTIRIGSAVTLLRQIPENSVDLIVTSPPYWQHRDYGVPGQIGNEEHLADYIRKLTGIFGLCWARLKPEGVMFLNLGETYSSDGKWGGKASAKNGPHEPRSKSRSGLPFKSACMVPFRVVLELQRHGWYVRQTMPWLKRNGMPESVKDRPTSAVEYVFMLARQRRCYYDFDAVERKVAPSTPARQARDERQTGNVTSRLVGGAYAPPGQPANSKARKPVAASRKYQGDTAGAFRRQSGANASSTLREREKMDRQTRRFRNTDLFFESLQPPHGLIADEAGEPLALDTGTAGYKGEHFATFPPKLIEPLILAGCPEGGLVLDPFAGAGTVGLVADRLKRNAILIELNPDTARQAAERINGPLLAHNQRGLEP